MDEEGIDFSFRYRNNVPWVFYYPLAKLLFLVPLVAFFVLLRKITFDHELQSVSSHLFSVDYSALRFRDATLKTLLRCAAIATGTSPSVSDDLDLPAFTSSVRLQCGVPIGVTDYTPL